MPDSLEALLAARLDVLTPTVRELVSTTAVLGERFDRGELVEVSESPPASVEEALGILVDRQLITVNTETLGNEYRFSHVLYQEAAYDRQLGGVRIDRHLRCAEVLERRGACRVSGGGRSHRASLPGGRSAARGAAVVGARRRPLQ